MTIAMRGTPAGGDTAQDNAQSSAPGPQPSGTEELGQGEISVQNPEDHESEFPHAELSKLDEMINRTRWVVPVLPKGELEVLLDVVIKLCKEGTQQEL